MTTDAQIAELVATCYARTEELNRFRAGEPGIYHDIPPEDYFALDAASNSFLRQMDEFSPEHARYWQDNGGVETTAAMKLGTAAHMAIFEPIRFDAHYIASERCAAVKADGERCKHPGTGLYGGSWLCGTHSKKAEHDDLHGHEILGADKYAGCDAMRARAHKHDDLATALICDGENELVIVFIDPKTKVLCKVRIDRWCRGIKAILDFKTTAKSAAEQEFSRTAANLRYRQQGCFYRRALRAVGEQVDGASYAAMETKPPHGLMYYRLREQDVDMYEPVIDAMLMQYAQCKKDGVWPGYSTNLVVLDMPTWERKQLELIGGI